MKKLFLYLLQLTNHREIIGKIFSQCGVCAARIILLEDQLGFMRGSASTKGRYVARCPQVNPLGGSNENNVTIDLNLLDRSKGPMHQPTLARANQWCNQFNKEASLLKI